MNWIDKKPAYFSRGENIMLKGQPDKSDNAPGMGNAKHADSGREENFTRTGEPELDDSGRLVRWAETAAGNDHDNEIAQPC